MSSLLSIWQGRLRGRGCRAIWACFCPSSSLNAVIGGRHRFGSHRQKHRHSMPEFCPGYIVQFRDQRRLAHLTEMFERALRKREPVMPITQRVLYALHPGDELLRLTGWFGELSRITCPLAQDSVLME